MIHRFGNEVFDQFGSVLEESPSPSSFVDENIFVKLEPSDSPTRSSSRSTEASTSTDIIIRRTAENVIAPTECVICSEPTRCLHYDVPSCNGCKTFFRRSVIARRSYVCKNGGNCKIRRGDRCRSCRFDAAVAAGMNVGAIKLPETLTVGAVLDDIERRKRYFVGEEMVPRKIMPKFEQTDDARVVDFLLYLETKWSRMRESVFNGRAFYETQLRDILFGPSLLGSADKYSKPKSWPIPLAVMAKHCGAKKDCQKSPRPPGPRYFPRFRDRHWMTSDILINIQLMKALPFFQRLDIEDQESLTIHVALVNTLLSEAWYSYERNSRTLILPDGFSPLSANQRSLLPISKIYPAVTPLEMEVFCRNIDPLFRVAPLPEEYCLLKAIIFCHADTPGLTERGREILENEREAYAMALLRRMQARMGSVEGARKYGDMIALVEVFFQFAQKKREFHTFIKALRGSRGLQDPPILECFIKNTSRD